MSKLEEPKKIEAILYQICLWLILYPKTLFFVLFKPMKSIRIVLNSEDGEYLLNPRIFWAISVFTTGYFLYRTEKFFIPIIDLEINDTQSFIAVIVLIWSVATGAFAAVACKEKYGSIDSIKLEPLFDAQCYISAIFAIGVYVSLSIQNIDQIPLSQTLCVATIIWFVVCEIIFFHLATKASIARSFMLFVAGMGMWTALNYFWALLALLQAGI